MHFIQISLPNYQVVGYLRIFILSSLERVKKTPKNPKPKQNRFFVCVSKGTKVRKSFSVVFRLIHALSLLQAAYKASQRLW